MKREIDLKFYLHTLVIGLILIISNFVAKYSVDLLGYNIMISVFIYPFIYFFTQLITKRYGFKAALITIVIAIISQFIVFFINNAVTDMPLILRNILGSIGAFAISSLVNIYVYSTFLKIKPKAKFLAMSLLYVTSLIIDMVAFALITNIAFDIDFIATNIIRTIIGLIMATFIVVINPKRKRLYEN